MIRVSLCDDQIVVTEGLRTILSTDPEIEVIGVAHDGSELLELIKEDQPDIVLVDLKMPVMNGILTTRKLRQDFPDIHVLILTTYDDDEWIFDALHVGAEGYLLKDLPPDQLIIAIKGTVKGNAYIDPKITSRVMDKAASVPQPRKSEHDLDLNNREMEVLRLIAKGFSNADIAERLFLSEGTVRNYTRGIFAKLEVTTRTQAAVAAIKLSIVDITDL